MSTGECGISLGQWSQSNMAELTRRDYRAAILYDYKRGLSVDETCRSLKQCFGELRAPSRTTIFNRFREFKSGRICLDKPEDMTGSKMEINLICEYLEKVRDLIKIDPTISQLEIAKKLGLDLGIVQTIVNNALKVGQLNLQWTPATVTDMQRTLRKDWASFMLEKFDNGNITSTKHIVACFNTWIYKCRTVRKSSRVTTEYWTFANSPRVVDKQMVICFFSISGISVIASMNNLRLLSSVDLIHNCLSDVINDMNTDSSEKKFLYIETLQHSPVRLLDYLQDRQVGLITLPESSPDLALGGSFLEPAFWTSIQKQRFASPEDAVIEYKNCLSNAVAEMWDQLFNWWFKRMKKCIDRNGDYVEPISYNLDLLGYDDASVVVNPHLVMPSPSTVHTPTPSTSATESTEIDTATPGTSKLTTATPNGVKRHFNFSPKTQPKLEQSEVFEFHGHDLEDGEVEAESDNEQNYVEQSGSSESEEEEEEESEDELSVHATAQPHGLKLTIPSNGQKPKTILLPASTIKTISPQIIKAQQQQAFKVNGITGIRLQNFKILGHTSGNVQQLRRQIYNNSMQAHIVAQAQAQQQQQLLQQQFSAAGVAVASTSGTRKPDKDLDSLSHAEYDEKAYPKPAYSYSCLIAMALKNSQTGSLPVSEIYNFMCEHFPYFRTAPNGWKNSVRHNLSLNKCFEKIEKPAGNGNQRKGCLWAINPAKITKMDEEVQKWSRKDPLAIKKAMICPKQLEMLERGEMRCIGMSTGSNCDLSEETESSSDEVEVRTHQLAANSITDSYDESSQDCDGDANEQSYDEIDIDENKESLHVQLNISKQEYQVVPNSKRQKTVSSTVQGNYVYQPVATARRKTPVAFVAATTAAAGGCSSGSCASGSSFIKLE